LDGSMRARHKTCSIRWRTRCGQSSAVKCRGFAEQAPTAAQRTKARN
jgi:hypothetical protein